ncbi:MAG: hypothetical protein HIU82_19175 [Proteobacteria bacterium]|nr:hypothetical protein [Pseudomonadota bacterium]
MKTHQWTVALAAAFALSGGLGLAHAAVFHGNGKVMMAANEQFSQGVGGNGSAKVGESYTDGVGGNGSAKAKTDAGQPGTAGSASNARGRPAWKQQQ